MRNNKRRLYFNVSKYTLLLLKNSHFFIFIYQAFFNYFSTIENFEIQSAPKTAAFEIHKALI